MRRYQTRAAGVMPLKSTHPSYQKSVARWELMRDSYEGERKVKEEGVKYLPATVGMIEDGALLSTDSIGYKAYQSYKTRAAFHNFVKEAVKTSLGTMHRRPAVIELPSAMEPLRERATVNGDPLDLLHIKINEEQLITGRLGLLLDLPEETRNPLPYLSMYAGERIRNWDDGRVREPVLQTLNLLVLDESEWIRTGTTTRFEWQYKEKYRVLTLGEVEDNETEGVYRMGLFDGERDNFSETELIEPNIRGVPLDQIPFVFINSMDLLSTPDTPPLENLGNLGMTVYRGEADYRQALFMQGQDTLVLIGRGEDEGTLRVGAGAQINIASTEGNAKFIGVDSQGLPEMRSALENDKADAQRMTGQFVERSAEAESGDALRRRMTSKSATLTEIAIAGAAGLEKILRIAAVWMGQNPNDVIVTPNLDFNDDEIDPAAANDWMSAKHQGLPLSMLSIWQKLKEGELTEFETLEEELAQIEQEMPFFEMNPGNNNMPDDGIEE